MKNVIGCDLILTGWLMISALVWFIREDDYRREYFGRVSFIADIFWGGLTLGVMSFGFHPVADGLLAAALLLRTAQLVKKTVIPAYIGGKRLALAVKLSSATMTATLATGALLLMRPKPVIADWIVVLNVLLIVAVIATQLANVWVDNLRLDKTFHDD